MYKFKENTSENAAPLFKVNILKNESLANYVVQLEAKSHMVDVMRWHDVITR